MRSIYPGDCGFGDMRVSIPLYPGYALNARGNIDRFRATAVYNQGHVINEVSFYIDVCCLWKDSSRS